ncbi:MAG: DNRLRE domain-containing protein, partial [bacterium]
SGADNTSTDRYSTSESSLSISTTGWKTWNVTSAIQSIVDGTDENYGFIIIGPTSGNNRAYFKSSECAEFELKPRLEIEWTY